MEKTSYRKSHNLSDEKPETKIPKYVTSRAIIDFDSIAWNSEAESCWHNAAPRSEQIRSQNYALFSRLKKRAGLGVIWFDAFPGNNNSALG